MDLSPKLFQVSKQDGEGEVGWCTLRIKRIHTDAEIEDGPSGTGHNQL